MNAPTRKIGRLHVITDTVVQDRFDHVELCRMAVRGGADTIQLRDKVLPTEKFLSVARDVLDVCRAARVPLIINDRLDTAAAIGSDGVHLGREDVAVSVARRTLGDRAVIGASAGSIEEAREAEEAGADYVGFGHLFPTRSKSKPGAPVGLEGLRRVCPAVGIPVIAIGGITPDNARGAVDAGAWGVAVIGAVCAAADPEAATRRLAGIVGAGNAKKG